MYIPVNYLLVILYIIYKIYMGDNLGNLSQDLDIFGVADDAAEDITAELTADDLFWTEPKVEDTTTTDGWDVKKEEIKDDVKVDGGDESKTDEVKDEKPDETKTDEPGKEEENNEDKELQEFIDGLLSDGEDVDEKIEEIKDKATDEGDNEMGKLIDELQTLIAEQRSKLEEQWKQLEVANTRYLDKVWEAEQYWVYKWVIDKLENDPKLMTLVKYYDTDNDKVKDRVVWVVTDLLYDLTWQDVTELLDKKVKDDVTTALWTSSSSPSATPEIPEEEDEPMNFEDSTNLLF